MNPTKTFLLHRDAAPRPGQARVTGLPPKPPQKENEEWHNKTTDQYIDCEY